jgi:hypothetical protein
MSIDRFDLEQHIMNCWNVCEDIKAVIKMHDIRNMSEDELLNVMIGLEALYQLKFETLFNVFEKMIANGQIK